eukprot:TRINITY_DN12421_c0_g1_i1.p1 TRINITY_DN12421_c0_g1~~TRINITY_DN12421_c0_g1_i1.p1  ORF type:complete len:669 (+),score=251.11 TRINITY_DN12421_c0_g1_i1:31-2007(+)
MSRLLKKLHGHDMLGGTRDSDESDTVEPSLMMATAQSRKNQKKKQKKAKATAEEDTKEETVQHVNVQPARQAKKKKKKKQQESEKEQHEDPDSDDLDAILKAHKQKVNKGKDAKEIKIEERSNTELARLLTCSGDALDPEEELKKMFGSAAIAQERREATENNRRRLNRAMPNRRDGRGVPRKATRFRETLLAKPDADTWPRYQNHGYSMTVTDGDLPKWRLTESGDCLKAATLLSQAVNSMQLEAFDALLYRYPYYIPTLLKYNEIVCQMGEFSEGAAMIDQALYTASIAAPPEFSWVAPFTAREMPFEGASKEVFLTIMVKVQSMIKRGCYRTALEWIKMLFNLNKKDPCHTLLLIDYCATKSGMWTWFMDLQKAMASDDKWFAHTSKLPNFKYGAALCAKLQGDDRANSLLTDAVRWYPHAVPLILTAVKGTGEAGAAEIMTVDLPDQAPSVESLVKLYVARSAELWGGPMVKWLIEVASKVKKASEDGSLVPVTELPAIAKSEAFVFQAQCEASAHMGRVEVLPQEAFEENEAMGGNEVPEEILELMMRLREDQEALGDLPEDDEDFEGAFDSEAMQLLAVAESEISSLQETTLAYADAPTDTEKVRINELVTRQLIFLDSIIPEGPEADEVRSKRRDLIQLCHQICERIEDPQ